jgi:D-glycerate 3-kinase
VSFEQAVAIATMIEEPLRFRLAQDATRPLVLGLCGAQGSGKTTIAARLKKMLEAAGFKTAILALDDLYLSRGNREILARTIHPLLATRGVPGTHDVALGQSLLDALGAPGAVRLPRFDKATDTRKPVAEWESEEAPAEIIIFEGWCVGARPQAEEALAAPVNALERDEDGDGCWRRWVNARLAGAYQALFARIEMLVLLAAPDFEIVSAWRRQQEHELRQALTCRGQDTSGTFDDRQIDRFILHYQRLTEHILAEMPKRADMVIWLDKQRQPRLVTQ